MAEGQKGGTDHFNSAKACLSGSECCCVCDRMCLFLETREKRGKEGGRENGEESSESSERKSENMCSEDSCTKGILTEYRDDGIRICTQGPGHSWHLKNP